ncbi:MAG: homocysteine S-methyltransferase family protein, partial [Lachnospiraceae bacterium]|nr:homocysteine S-methyltransferase family protein [Lachnospiraceae bacterium]
MKKELFRIITDDNILTLDGATGSFLLAAGMPPNVCQEEWVLNHPDVLIGLQKQYVEAGSDII